MGEMTDQRSIVVSAKKINSLDNNAYEMFVNLNITFFDDLLLKFVLSFRSSIQDSVKSLVNDVEESFSARYGTGGVIFLTHNHYIVLYCIFVCIGPRVCS